MSKFLVFITSFLSLFSLFCIETFFLNVLMLQPLEMIFHVSNLWLDWLTKACVMMMSDTQQSKHLQYIHSGKIFEHLGFKPWHIDFKIIWLHFIDTTLSILFQAPFISRSSRLGVDYIKLCYLNPSSISLAMLHYDKFSETDLQLLKDGRLHFHVHPGIE